MTSTVSRTRESRQNVAFLYPGRTWPSSPWLLLILCKAHTHTGTSLTELKTPVFCPSGPPARLRLQHSLHPAATHDLSVRRHLLLQGSQVRFCSVVHLNPSINDIKMGSTQPSDLVTVNIPALIPKVQSRDTGTPLSEGHGSQAVPPSWLKNLP